MRTALLSAALAALFTAAFAQTPTFTPIPPLAFDNSGPLLRAHTEALKPFTVAGEHGVVLGQQDGTFEAWVLPVKILSHLTIEADIQGYTVPIDVNEQSAEIEVHPDRTIITYSHIGFTVRQIMFSPNSAPAGTGPIVLFQFDCLHSTDFTFRFTPNLEYMWPERNEGHPSPEWVAPGPDAWKRAGGFYVLHSDYPDLAAAITMPDARAGILAPYQERPQTHPVELKLHIDPTQDKDKLYPLLMAVGTNTATATTQALGHTLEELNHSIAAEYATHAKSYDDLLAHSVSIDTPNKKLDQAFQWAEVSIEQLKAKPFCPLAAPQSAPNAAAQSGHDPTSDLGGSPQSQAPSVTNRASGRDLSRAENPPAMGGALAPAVCANETALVAGYYASGDSARPGFGWFFGRDALYTLYAVNGYGDFALAKSELEFLIHRQRADGKIMHEYSQTASAIDWLQFPYMYAAADSTPLFLLATLDYVRASGDTAFLAAHRNAIEKAWQFETTHADTNGIYDNRQGTGWVESWPGGMPHQEIYLALLDQQASAAMAQIEDLLHDTAKSQQAKSRADSIAKTINEQFPNGDKGCYAFSRNENGSLDHTTTVYPALAWWSALPGTAQRGGDNSILDHPGQCLQQFASADLDTDWGLRDLSNKESIYDGMSYHQGSVWPLFTGWAALAEYRGNQPLAGYRMLMQNANLTTAQDLGAVTELLSGDFFVPFGRSTSHQLWSSAMVITPTLRGLFGISIDAQTKTITVNPHLPAGWDHADVRNLQLGGGSASLNFRRVGDSIEIQLISGAASDWRVRTDNVASLPGSARNTPISSSMRIGSGSGLRIATPPLEVDQTLSSLTAGEGRTERDEVMSSLPDHAPVPGVRTARLRIISAEYGSRSLKLVAEGVAGSKAIVSLVRHTPITPKMQVSGGEAKLSTPDEDPSAAVPLEFRFPDSPGWQTITVTLTW